MQHKDTALRHLQIPQNAQLSDLELVFRTTAGVRKCTMALPGAPSHAGASAMLVDVRSDVTESNHKLYLRLG